jgi:hypothetical protein
MLVTLSEVEGDHAGMVPFDVAQGDMIGDTPC